jgi:predicted MFS family arabinose efflux permease
MKAPVTPQVELAPQQLGIPEQIATRIIFFIIGLAVGAWAPLVPYAKERLNMEEGGLGLLLLCLGAGSLVMMPFTGMLAGRFGCRVVITVASLFTCASLPFLATASHPISLGLALFVFGAAVGSADVAVNIQAVAVEKASGRALMSGFHGLYSLGGILGAAGTTGLLTLQLTPLLATFCVVGLVLALLAAFAKNLLGYASQNKEPLFVMPRGKIIFIGLLCFIVFLAEGSVLDWSALFLSSRRGMSPTQAGLGYAAFATAMTLGRLTGDRIVVALGDVKVILFGGLCAAAGFLLAVLTVSPITSLIGFILVGLGASNIVPVLFTAAGKQTSMPAGLAISSITTIGYAGILAGPAFIGFIARLSSLEVTFAMVAVLLLIVAASAKPVTR